MRKVFMFFAAVAAVLSCTKETPVSEINPEKSVVTINAGAPTTKTQLVDGTDVQWTPGDKIKMCFDVRTWQSNNVWTGVEFENSSESVSESAVFIGSVDVNNVQDYGFVVYPTSLKFDSRTSGGYGENYTTTISHVLPSVQPAVENTFASDLNLSYAPVTKKQVTDNISGKTPIKVEFENLCALIKVTLPVEEYNVSEIRIESTSAGLTGEYSMLWEATSTKQTLKLDSFKSEVKEVAIANEDGSSLTPGASYYAVVWPGQHSGLKFIFTDKDGKECIKNLNKTVTCKTAEITEINVKSMEFKEAEPELTVNTNNLEFAAIGGNANISFTTNKDWAITTDASLWLEISPKSGNASKEEISVNVHCYENAQYQSRTGNITISAGGLTKTIKVTQAAAIKTISLSVSTTSLSVAGQGGTASFTVTCNDNWTITDIPDWMTLSRTSGTESTSAITVNVTVKQNLFYNSNSKSITIRSNSDNSVVKYISISQKGVSSFTIGEAVGKAGDMQDGQVYIIRNNSNQDYYWRALSGNLVYNTWTDGAMSITYAFIYHRDDSKGKSSDNRYTSVSTGAWQSCHTGNYLASDFKVNVNKSSAVYVANSNRWGSDKGNDIDMCQIGSTYSIAWNGSKYLWGSTSEGNRKWLVYNATPQY